MNPEARGRPAALLVTHGALGKELLHTVETILGSQTDVLTLSNEGRSAEALTEAIESGVRSVAGAAAVVVFTDLAAGSCGIAARRIRVEGRAVLCVSGVNLPMLLEFFHYRDTLPLDDLLARIEMKGKAGIVIQ